MLLPRRPKVLVPELTQRVVYSEILNRWMSVYMTARAQYLIDEAFGLDNYILQVSCNLKDYFNILVRFISHYEFIKNSSYLSIKKVLLLKCQNIFCKSQSIYFFLF